MNYSKFGFPVPIGAVAGSYAGGYGAVIPNYSYVTAPFYGKPWPI
jgi:hypothetical protein